MSARSAALIAASASFRSAYSDQYAPLRARPPIEIEGPRRTSERTRRTRPRMSSSCASSWTFQTKTIQPSTLLTGPEPELAVLSKVLSSGARVDAGPSVAVARGPSSAAARCPCRWRRTRRRSPVRPWLLYEGGGGGVGANGGRGLC